MISNKNTVKCEYGTDSDFWRQSYTSLETQGAMRIRHMRVGDRVWFVITENFLDAVTLWFVDEDQTKVHHALSYQFSGRSVVAAEIGLVRTCFLLFGLTMPQGRVVCRV